MAQAVSAERKSIFDYKLHRKYPGLKEIEKELEPNAKYTFIRESLNNVLKVLFKPTSGLKTKKFNNIPGLAIIQYTHDMGIAKHSWIMLFAYEINDETNIRETASADERILKIPFTSDSMMFIEFLIFIVGEQFTDFNTDRIIYRCIYDKYNEVALKYSIIDAAKKLNDISEYITGLMCGGTFKFTFFITPDDIDIWVRIERNFLIS